MIKTVLFDLGNVILPFDVTRLAARLTAYCSISKEDIVKHLWSDRIADDFESGRMTPENYFEYTSKLCGFSNLTFDEFVPIFNDIFVEDRDVSDLIGHLKKSYQLGLISNANAIHVPHVLETYGTLKHFERHWWSYQEGMRKPNPSIYRRALDHFKVKPEETVFIDDMHINIESAKKLGINGLLYTGAKALKADLSNLGVL